MAKVRLDFTPPSEPGVSKLKIWESTTKLGAYAVIEEVDEVGVYPNYISYHTTSNASAPDNWFAISWEDSEGAEGELSLPIQGGTDTLIARLVRRVQNRDASINEVVATEEAETVVSEFYGVDDPYAVTEWKARELSGLTFLVMARSYIGTMVVNQSAGESYTAGLVSQKSSSGSTSDPRKFIESLIVMANNLLGLNFSFIALMEEVDPIGTGVVSGVEDDRSRLLMTEIP